MGKGRFFGRMVAVAVVALAVAAKTGCGGNSNDQGISFRALGWFQDTGGSEGLTGLVGVPFDCEDALTAVIGLENRMVQSIQTERFDFTYRVSAGRLNIPRDSFPESTFIEGGDRDFAEIVVVSTPLLQFLQNNRNQLPDLPFIMVATASALGITDSGDEFRTNRVSLAIEFVEGGC